MLRGFVQAAPELLWGHGALEYTALGIHGAWDTQRKRDDSLRSFSPRPVILSPVRSFFPPVFLGLPILAGGFALSETVHAEPYCEKGVAHVTLAFVGEWTGQVKDGALSDLSAALGPQRMGVCLHAEGPTSDKSVSSVRVELLEGHRVKIEVDDALTQKTVARDIRLDSPTDSASALIVAVAIDELLRATWAELSFKQEPPQESGPEALPSEKQKAGAPRPGDTETQGFPSQRLALEGAVDAFVEGSVFFGANIVYGRSFEKIEWSAFAGPRLVRAKNASELGEVRADALTFGAAVSMPLIATKAFYFGPELGLAASHVWFRGRAESTPDSPAEEDEFQGWGLTARGGLGARVHLGAAFVGASVRVGYPLLALEVRDDSEVIGGMTGLEWSNGLSLGWRWR